MANKLVLVTLLALATVAVAEKKLSNVASIVEKMLDVFPMPVIPEGYTSSNPRTVGHKFRTRLDHFNPQNRATFEFEYNSNDEYYRPGGPIFVVVGGNFPLFHTSFFIEHGHFHDIASYENAWMFTNEHRFYGNSIPTPDLEVDNLRYLTVEQAMVDLAEWINHLRHNVVRDPNAQVILMGWGYAGAMATWMRQRYPHLVDGVWASSGQVEARLNFKEYAREVGDLIREHGSNECYSQIWRAFRTAENLLDAGLNTTVQEMFNTCDPIDTDTMLDVETFFFHIKMAMQSEILDRRDTESTTELCEALGTSAESTDLQTIGNWVQDRYNFLDCMPFDFNTIVSELKHIDNEHPENSVYGLRARLYQVCTEFGWFLTTDSPDQPFGYRVSVYFFMNMCKAVFGEWLTEEVVADGVHLTNMHFGGKNPRITNAVFTNGGYDPLREVSITELYYQHASAAMVIPGYFQIEDLLSISGNDSPAMLEVKHLVKQFIQIWLWRPIPVKESH